MDLTFIAKLVNIAFVSLFLLSLAVIFFGAAFSLLLAIKRSRLTDQEIKWYKRRSKFLVIGVVVFILTFIVYFFINLTVLMTFGTQWALVNTVTP